MYEETFKGQHWPRCDCSKLVRVWVTLSSRAAREECSVDGRIDSVPSRSALSLSIQSHLGIDTKTKRNLVSLGADHLRSYLNNGQVRDLAEFICSDGSRRLLWLYVQKAYRKVTQKMTKTIVSYFSTTWWKVE